VGLEGEDCRPCPEAAFNIVMISIAVTVLFMAVILSWVVLLKGDKELFAVRKGRAAKDLVGMAGKQTYKKSSEDQTIDKQASTSGLFDTADASDSRTSAADIMQEISGIDLGNPNDFPTVPRTKPFLNRGLFRSVISFIQIFTGVNNLVSLRYPPVFLVLISFMDIFNLKILPWESLACATTFTIFDQVYIFSCIPAVMLIFIAIFQLYFCLRRASHMSDDAEQSARFLTLRRAQGVKMFVFGMYVILPKLSQMILSTLLCIEVDRVFYVVDDLSVVCGVGLWADNVFFALCLMGLYVVGIPVLAAWMLYRKRNKLKNPVAIIALGFLYQGYDQVNYWFPIVDYLHKLFLIGALQFLPGEYQGAIGMIAVCVFYIIILVRHPFIYKENDLMAQLVQVALYNYLLAGWFTFQEFQEIVVDPFADIVLSTLLIGLVAIILLALLFWTCLRALKIMRGLRRRRQRDRLRAEFSSRELHIDLRGDTSGSFKPVVPEETSQSSSNIAFESSSAKPRPPPPRPY
jgi:hypothetical protein